jgi:hypothetical protein
MLNEKNMINLNAEENLRATGTEQSKQVWQTPKFELLSKNDVILSGSAPGAESTGAFFS